MKMDGQDATRLILSILGREPVADRSQRNVIDELDAARVGLRVMPSSWFSNRCELLAHLKYVEMIILIGKALRDDSKL